MGEVRHVRVFKNGRSRAIRIPRDMDTFGDEVVLRKEGEELVVAPRPKTDLLEWLSTREPLPPEDWMPPIKDLAPEPITVFDDWAD